MPWSAWIVGIVFALTLVPYFGEYVTLLIVFVAALIFGGASARLSTGQGTLAIANAIGINPNHFWLMFSMAIFLGVGIFFAVRAFRSNGERGLNTAILLLGFVFIASVSLFRLTKAWPT
jgi:hypothetical protein